MEPDNKNSLDSFLTQAMGVAPSVLRWPQEFLLGQSELPAVFDPHNALLTVVGACATEISESILAPVLAAARQPDGCCSRLLVFARQLDQESWSEMGFQHEGIIAGYWPDGSSAELWARQWGERNAGSLKESATVELVGASPGTIPGPLPANWICRVAQPDDAEHIRDLLRLVFPNYPIADDPGSLRYALAMELVHGRLVCNAEGQLIAYAAWEFQGSTSAVELADCATNPLARKRGLMAYLVQRLQEDLEDVFAGRVGYCLARDDQPAMQAVLIRSGWKPKGYLRTQFRMDDRWISARLWCP